MNETLLAPRVGRPVRLIEQLVWLRRSRRPQASESGGGRGGWGDLRERARLDAPHQPTRATVGAGASVPVGLLTAELRERGTRGGGEGNVGRGQERRRAVPGRAIPRAARRPGPAAGGAIDRADGGAGTPSALSTGVTGRGPAGRQRPERAR